LLESPNVPATHITALVNAAGNLDASAPQIAVDDTQPCYVIYTSGSTGLPKGVVLKHCNVVNYLLSMAQRPGFGPTDTILAATTLSFDIAVTELLLPLVTGGCSVLVDRDVAVDGNLLREVIETAGINVYQATPSSWRLLLAADWMGDRALKAITGGEALPGDLIAQLIPRVRELWNGYGPTETTVYSTFHHVRSEIEDVGLIGTPVANTQCYILNEHLQQVPIGVIGELCIGGSGVAAGYLNRPDLTSERFIDDPFPGGGKLYRTGDLARLRYNGLIEYLGRNDHQVKVRGYRIEVGEIENVLAEFPDLSQSVVVARKFDDGDVRLVAYLIGRQDKRIDVSELRQFLRDRLPTYMVPAHLMQLDRMPMTPNLKVDRKALPAPAVTLDAESRLPVTESQLQLAGIWKQILKIDHVLLEDNFFDCGGHSLTAIDAIRLVHQQTGHRFEVREFIMETLEQLAAKLDAPPLDAAPGHADVLPSAVATNRNSKGFGKLIRRLSGKGD
jgi:amino acid adenylation domain-containing protein